MTNSIELRINGQTSHVSAGSTIALLLEHLRLDSQQVAVEVNLELVPREQHPRHTLRAGDRVEVVTLVGGG